MSDDLTTALEHHRLFAKIAAAVAGRIFNSDKAAKRLIVDTKCVRAALDFIEQLYTSNTMSYKFYSQLRQKVVWIPLLEVLLSYTNKETCRVHCKEYDGSKPE